MLKIKLNKKYLYLSIHQLYPAVICYFTIKTGIGVDATLSSCFVLKNKYYIFEDFNSKIPK